MQAKSVTKPTPDCNIRSRTQARTKGRKINALQHVAALAEVVGSIYHHAYGQDHKHQRDCARKDRLPLVVAAPVFVSMSGYPCGGSTVARQSTLGKCVAPKGGRDCEAGGAPRSAAEMLPTVIDMFNLRDAPWLNTGLF